MITIEISIRLQDKGITQGRIFHTSNHIKIFSYASIMLMSLYWGFTDHLLYLWDELLWIGGFAAIEMNITDWRDEIENEHAEAGL